jgi:Spy/CpxP family protein refolding chaperone
MMSKQEYAGVKRFFNGKLIAGFAVGVVATLGVTAFAASQAVGGMHNAIALTTHAHDPMAHAQIALAHLYSAVNATDAQKAQIEPLVQQAMTDLAPYHTQFGSAHTQLLTLFTADTIDRAALESLRSQQMQNADLATRRIVQLFADIGDVLTPAQRGLLAQHVKSMHQAQHPAQQG